MFGFIYGKLFLYFLPHLIYAEKDFDILNVINSNNLLHLVKYLFLVWVHCGWVCKEGLFADGRSYT